MVHDPQDRSVSPAAIPQVPASPFADFTFASCREAALHWLDFGFRVIPVIPGKKVTAVRWDPWLDGLSAQKVDQHWRRHPDHEVGFIVGDDYIVFDADTPEACVRLEAAETAHGLEPYLVVHTQRGVHHYFRRAVGTCVTTALARTDDPSLKVDIKTGRTMVILPPSTGKTVGAIRDGIRRASDLTIADRAFVDSILPAAREIARASKAVARAVPGPELGQMLPLLQACLKRLDPDMSYLQWFAVAAVLFNETAADEGGYELFDAWSSDGRKYKSRRETRALWRRLRPDHPRPLTLATLRRMLEKDGHDWMDICCDVDGGFQIVDEEGAR